MLHLFFTPNGFPAIWERMAAGDSGVFLGDGVLVTLQQHALANYLSTHLSNKYFYIVAEDMTIRGIQPSELVAGLQIIDYAELVRLTIQEALIKSWY